MPQSERRSFTFENVHLAPDEQIGLHQQSTWELSYVIVGSGMRLIGDMTEPFLGGEVVMKFHIAGTLRAMIRMRRAGLRTLL